MISPRPVLIDTDGGVDDAAALWWALTDPRFDVVGITAVAGNVDVEMAAGNVLRVIEAAGRSDIPVALGRGGPIGPAPELRRASFIHGDNGLGNVHLDPPAGGPTREPAADLLRRVAGERPGEVALVTLGPLSTIGHLVTADPGFAEDVAELVIMGGSVRLGGNALPAAEANIGHDPTAAHAVVTAPWRTPPLMVGLDVTTRATLTESEFALLAERRTPAAAFLDQPLHFYRRFGSRSTAPDCPCHDLVALLALVEPDLVPEQPVLPLAVQAQPGPAWGATVADFRHLLHAGADDEARQATFDGFALWRVGLTADVARFRHLVRQLFGA